MPLPQFNIKIPPTKKFKCWLATTGGHCDHVIVSLKAPGRKKDKYFGGFEVPEGSMRIGLGDFLAWFCDDKPDALVELGLLTIHEHGSPCPRPLSTRVEKWVRAEITVPCEELEGHAYGKHSKWDNIYGLNLYDQFG